MELRKRGWLKQTLTDVVAAYQPDLVTRSYREAVVLPTAPARARRYLRGILRETGLLFGTPSGRAPEPRAGQGPEEILFLAVLRTFGRVALDVATLADAAPGPRAEQLLLLLAALANRLDDAEDIHRRIERATRQWPLPEKLWTRVEESLERRALSLAADPYFGLVLHNGAVYADANLFGRLALAYFTRSAFPREAAERRVHFAAMQKALLVDVLIGLVCSERTPSYPTRRAILRQIDDLQLPDELADATRDFARKAFTRPPAMRAVLKSVRSRDMKRFILEQTLLASLVDGRRSPGELEWTRALGQQLGFPKDEVRTLELGMAEFYAAHREVVDVFTLAAGAEVMGEELVDTMSATVRRNYRRVLKEVRQTGELSVLLARAARGQSLNREEKRKMREQLIDVAKAVPALAIFAAPGGFLLLIALAKVLPFDMLPSAFRDEPERESADDSRTTH